MRHRESQKEYSSSAGGGVSPWSFGGETLRLEIRGKPAAGGLIISVLMSESFLVMLFGEKMALGSKEPTSADRKHNRWPFMLQLVTLMTHFMKQE